MATHAAPRPEEAASADPTEARLRAASALRRLGHAFVGHQIDDDLLREMTSRIEALTAEVEQAPAREHNFFSHDRNFVTEQMEGGTGTLPNGVFPDSVVSGKANPMSMEANLRRDGDGARLEVTLGPAFEGAPGRAHGAVVAALIDETMGLALSVTGELAFTGKLAITYRAPTPMGVPLTVRARLSDHSGRKLTITAELHSGPTLLAEAEGLFITVDPSRFLGVDQVADPLDH